jgi:hypothetical protein
VGRSACVVSLLPPESVGKGAPAQGKAGCQGWREPESGAALYGLLRCARLRWPTGGGGSRRAASAGEGGNRLSHRRDGSFWPASNSRRRGAALFVAPGQVTPGATYRGGDKEL